MVFLIVDDHPMVVEGYCAILKQKYPESLFYCALNIKEAVELLNTLSYVDICVLDYNIGAADKLNKIENGVDLASVCQKKFKYAKIVMITAHEEVLVVYSIHKHISPDGILIKSDVGSEVLTAAIDAVKDGEKYYSKKVKSCMKAVTQKELMQQEYNIQILMLLAQGFKIREISDLLSVSEGMIQKRIIGMKEVFNVQDNGGLVREAKLQGFI